MARYGRPADGESIRDLLYRARPFGQHLHDGASVGVAQSVERIGIRRKVFHDRHTPDGNIRVTEVLLAALTLYHGSMRRLAHLLTLSVAFLTLVGVGWVRPPATMAGS